MRFTLFIVTLLFATSPICDEYSPEMLHSGSNDYPKLGEMIISNDENKSLPLPSQEIIVLAIKGHHRLVERGVISKEKPLVVIDFSLPSTKKRLWVIDIETGSILFNDFVSHGRNSGDLYATSFSNQNSSYQSSLGFYLTAETYFGKHGYSLRLDGLETGINDNARERAIVIHGADYANPDFIDKTGRLGRSLGCPALPLESARGLIDLIKEKSCLFIYGNEPSYFQNSLVLQG